MQPPTQCRGEGDSGWRRTEGQRAGPQPPFGWAAPNETPPSQRPELPLQPATAESSETQLLEEMN